MEENTKLTKEEFNNSTIIRNISYDQKEILYNIMTLHNGGKPFDCDITASSLKFYEDRKGGPLQRKTFRDLKSKDIGYPEGYHS